MDVTVVIPAYNAARTLNETLRSVARVLHAHIIVVDDGSTDETASIARSFGAELVEQENSGASIARANGISRVDTEFTIALDSDDQLAEGIQESLKLMTKEPDIAILGGSVEIMSSQGKSRWRGKPPAAHYSLHDLLKEPVSPWPPCAAIWRTSALRLALDHPIPALAPRLAEDYELLIRGALVGTISGAPFVAARYRAFGGKSSARAVEALTSAEAIRQYYADALQLTAPPISPGRLRERAAWRLFRAMQVEHGLGGAIVRQAAHPMSAALVAKAGTSRVASAALGRAYQAVPGSRR